MDNKSREASMRVRGMRDVRSLNKLFARRFMYGNDAVCALLADSYIASCKPEVGKRLWGIITYINSDGKSPHYGVQLDDENNTLVYCKKNSANINNFLDSVGQILGEKSEEWYYQHPDELADHKERKAERFREYLLWEPRLGCEVQILIVGYDEESGLYFGVLELDAGKL